MTVRSSRSEQLFAGQSQGVMKPGAEVHCARFWVGCLLQEPWTIHGSRITHHGSRLAFRGLDFLFFTPLSLREQRAGFLATEYATENVAMAADPGVNLFRKPDHARDPEKQRHRNQQRHAQPEVTKAARAAINPAVFRNAMDRRGQVFGL